MVVSLWFIFFSFFFVFFSKISKNRDCGISFFAKISKKSPKFHVCHFFALFEALLPCERQGIFFKIFPARFLKIFLQKKVVVFPYKWVKIGGTFLAIFSQSMPKKRWVKRQNFPIFDQKKCRKNLLVHTHFKNTPKLGLFWTPFEKSAPSAACWKIQKSFFKIKKNTKKTHFFWNFSKKSPKIDVPSPKDFHKNPLKTAQKTAKKPLIFCNSQVDFFWWILGDFWPIFGCFLASWEKFSAYQRHTLLKNHLKNHPKNTTFFPKFWPVFFHFFSWVI